MGAGFDEAETQFGKLLVNLAQHDIVEGCHRRNAEAVKRRSDAHRMVVQVAQPGIAVGDMNRDRHVELLRFVVDRIKVRVGEQAIAFDGAQQTAHSAVFFGPANLIQRIGHAEQSAACRTSAGGLVALFPNVAEPAIPALAQRDVDRGRDRCRTR